MIDDHHNRPHDCDLVLDYNFYASEERLHSQSQSRSDAQSISSSIYAPVVRDSATACAPLVGMPYVLLSEKYRE